MARTGYASATGSRSWTPRGEAVAAVATSMGADKPPAPFTSSLRPRRLITPAEAEEAIGVRRATLYRAVRLGRLRASRLPRGRWATTGRARRILLDPAEVESLIPELTVEKARRALDAAQAWDAFASKRGPTSAALRNGKPTGRTRERLSAMFSVSPYSIQVARAVLRDPDLADAVRRGEIALYAAYAELRARDRVAA